jgi:hypothetical protein
VKVIQFQIVVDLFGIESLTILCDDGSIWTKDANRGWKKVPLPAILCIPEELLKKEHDIL